MGLRASFAFQDLRFDRLGQLEKPSAHLTKKTRRLLFFLAAMIQVVLESFLCFSKSFLIVDHLTSAQYSYPQEPMIRLSMVHPSLRKKYDKEKALKSSPAPFSALGWIAAELLTTSVIGMCLYLG